MANRDKILGQIRITSNRCLFQFSNEYYTLQKARIGLLFFQHFKAWCVAMTDADNLSVKLSWWTDLFSIINVFLIYFEFFM